MKPHDGLLCFTQATSCNILRATGTGDCSERVHVSKWFCEYVGVCERPFASHNSNIKILALNHSRGLFNH